MLWEPSTKSITDGRIREAVISVRPQELSPVGTGAVSPVPGIPRGLSMPASELLVPPPPLEPAVVSGDVEIPEDRVSEPSPSSLHAKTWIELTMR